MQHPEAVTDTGLWPSQRQRQIPLGRTGYAYDPDVAKAAEEESLGYYLRRQTPAWNQRAQLEQDKEKAALQRTTVQQTGQTDRERERNARLAAAAAAADATRRQIAATTDATRRQIATTPRPRAAGVAGERDLAGWQRTLAQAQSALRDAEMGGTLGKARDEPGTEPDRAAYKDDAAYRVANGAYLRQVRRYHDRRTEVQQAQDQVRDAQQHVSQLQSGGGAAPANGGRKQQITSDQRDYLRSQGHPDAWINARYVVR
jgi:hypothetical protein